MHEPYDEYRQTSPDGARRCSLAAHWLPLPSSSILPLRVRRFDSDLTVIARWLKDHVKRADVAKIQKSQSALMLRRPWNLSPTRVVNQCGPQLINLEGMRVTQPRFAEPPQPNAQALLQALILQRNTKGASARKGEDEGVAAEGEELSMRGCEGWGPPAGHTRERGHTGPSRPPLQRCPKAARSPSAHHPCHQVLINVRLRVDLDI